MRKAKTPRVGPTPNSEPVKIALPNTTVEKMRAIVALSDAVYELAKALVSVNTQVTISNCSFVGDNTNKYPLLDIKGE